MNKKRYFAASNSELGFVSYFDENFRCDRCNERYIIKGGPGTGKSRLLCDIGAEGDRMGGDVEYYYCSSDPTSLDGVVIRLGERCISVIDGTAPHSHDVILPGAVDNIIDTDDINSKWLK